MIPSAQVFELALSLATEDYFGLYELVWKLNSKFEDSDPAERLAAAHHALQRLTAEGLTAVYRTQWMSEEYDAVATELTERVLADPSAWASPAERPDGSFYCFTSTPLGDARYFGRPAADAPAG